MTRSTDPGSCAGFTADVKVADARRQLRLSVGVVATLAFAIISAAVTIGSHPAAARRPVASAAPAAVPQVGAGAVASSAI